MMSKKQPVKKAAGVPLVLGRVNFLLFFISLIVLAIGYYLLSIPPWDNFLSRTLAPVVLLFGYLVIIPAAIFARSKSPKEADKRSA